MKTLNKIESTNTLLLETSGFSMWPFIKKNERLIIRKVPIDNLKRGDVILYKAKDLLACHRLVNKKQSKGEYELYVRGDNSQFSLEAVNNQMYVGKVISIVKNDKEVDITSSMQCLINRIIVVISPFLSWIVKFVKPAYRKFRKMKII